MPKRPTPELTPEQIRAIETGEELSPEEIRQFAEMLDLGAVVEDLLRLKRHLAQAGDFTGANSRNAALASLLGVMRFLNRQLHISPPALIALQLALSDLDDGKVHPLLKPADATGQRLGASRKEQHHRSKVSTETRLLWGCAASAMDCLMQSGFKSDEAATIVGRKLSRLKIEFGDSRGASIGQSIKNWRSRAMRGDPESDLDANVYYELRRMFTHSTNAALDRKNLVKVLEESLRKLGVIA